MGQKVNPTLLRTGPVYTWNSRWFNDKNYKVTLLEDFKVRNALMARLKNAGVARVEIERSINNIKVIAYVSKPGIVIGRGGAGVEEVKKYLISLLTKKGEKQPSKIDLRIEGVKEPNLDAYLVARNISDQLARRMPFKRVIAQSAERAMGSGAKGIRIVLAGRINGAEIGRREKLQKGTVPLSTIREHINYASVPSLTQKGYIGVKVWINNKEEKEN